MAGLGSADQVYVHATCFVIVVVDLDNLVGHGMQRSRELIIKCKEIVRSSRNGHDGA